MKKIRVGLLGLGRTGKIVANNLFRDKRFKLVFAAKNKAPSKGELSCLEGVCEIGFGKFVPEMIKRSEVEAVIDFSTPKATLKNIKNIPAGTKLVVATTGFTTAQLRSLKSAKKLSVLYAPNISDGINIIMSACKKINDLWKRPDIEIIEQHFKGKKDAPSGTAKKIADLFPEPVSIHSVRAGKIVGIHEIIFAAENQKIILRHESFNREVFAQGAKRAILWLIDKKPGFYTVDQVYEKIKK